MVKKISSLALKEKGIYLIPNLFTLSALFFGFYAVVAGIQGRYQDAAIAIVLGLIMDSLDGRVARLMHTQSDFGADLDSLSDVISFGLAPALVMYLWQLQHFGQWGWAVAFTYVASVALRLAKFNNVSDKRPNNYFQGLPCPAPAGLLAGLLWTVEQSESVWFDSHMGGITLMVLMLSLSALMLSSIPYYSGKKAGNSGKVSFYAVVFVVLLLVVFSIIPAVFTLAFFSGYVIYGVLAAGWSCLKGKCCG